MTPYTGSLYTDSCGAFQMKIMIFGHARSGSSALQKYLSETKNLTDLDEPLTDSTDREILNMLKEQDDYVAKITSGNFFFWDMGEIDLSVYDQVWITERTNKTDVLASVYIAAATGNYGKQEKQKFTIPQTFLTRWQGEMQYFYQYRKIIRESRSQLVHVTYDEILSMTRGIGSYDPSDMEYSQDCENYADMQRQVAYIINKLERDFGN